MPISFLLAQIGPGSLKDAERYLKEIGPETPILEKTDLETLIFRIVQYLLGFLGVAAILIIVYGGYLWMTAAGNEEKIKKGKSILRDGILGLAVIILAYTVSIFVIYLIRGELPE